MSTIGKRDASATTLRLADRITDTDRLLSMGRVFPPGTFRLDRGDPDVPTPAHICDAARQAMADGYTHYVPGHGDKDLVDAICETANGELGANFVPDGVLVTNGAAEAIFLACAAYLTAGDEAIVFTPGYGFYAACVAMVGASPVWVPLTSDHHLDRDALRDAVTPRTRAIFFSNPPNPTGIAFGREDLGFLAELAIEHDFLLCPDEVYRKFYYGGARHQSLASIESVRDRTIFIDSFSKSYAMTGWRIGYLATTPQLMAPMHAVQRTTVSCVNWPTQRAALAALRGPQECVAALVAEFGRRRALLVERLASAPRFRFVAPDSSFYVIGVLDGAPPDFEPVGFLAERGIAIKGGGEFGPAAAGHLRLTFANEPNIEGAADRLIEVLAEIPEMHGQ